MKAVIIAAGTGSRMGQNAPKTLMKFGDKTILWTIMNSIAGSGIREFIIVVGYEANQIRNYVASQADLNKFRVEFAENPEWTRGNGLSVLYSEPYVNNEPFILSMSDHIVSTEAITRMVQSKLQENLLLVDPAVSEVFDIDDATKVRANNDVIVDIGKEISGYNCIDCGIFRLTSRYFDSMRKKLVEKKESISSAITGLIDADDMRAIFMKRGEYWSDIDTPQAYDNALKIFGKHYPQG